MTMFLSSDLHLAHLRALEIMPHRPWDTVEAMNKGLIDNYNSVVKPTDICIFVGDLVMGSKAVNVPLYIPQLAGIKILITGNHDFLPSEIKTQEKLEWYERLYKDSGIKYIAHGCVKLSEFTCKKEHEKIKLCHFPPSCVKDHNEEYDLKYRKFRPVLEDDEILFHGHTHSREHISAPNIIHVGVDAEAWKFKPVALDTLLELV